MVLSVVINLSQKPFSLIENSDLSAIVCLYKYTNLCNQFPVQIVLLFFVFFCLQIIASGGGNPWTPTANEKNINKQWIRKHFKISSTTIKWYPVNVDDIWIETSVNTRSAKLESTDYGQNDGGMSASSGGGAVSVGDGSVTISVGGATGTELEQQQQQHSIIADKTEDMATGSSPHDGRRSRAEMLPNSEGL